MFGIVVVMGERRWWVAMEASFEQSFFLFQDRIADMRV